MLSTLPALTERTRSDLLFGPLGKDLSDTHHDSRVKPMRNKAAWNDPEFLASLLLLFFLQPGLHGRQSYFFPRSFLR